MRSRSILPIAAVVTALLAPAPAPAADEGSARITVTVKDSGGVIPSATVRLTNEATRSSARATTDDHGVATFSSLAAGSYALRAEFSGFAPHEQAGITLGAGEQKTVEATLTLAQFSTTVTVTTNNRREELLLNVANPTTLIDGSQIEDTGARTAKDVLIEQNGSGVQVQAGGGQGHVSINGIPNSGVLVLIDGRRYLGKDANGNFNLEDLQIGDVERVEVVKGAGSALYGADALGGVINFITKKGTNPGATNRLDFTGGSYSDLRVGDTLGYRSDRGGLTASGGYRTFDGFDLDENNPQTIGQPKGTWRYFSGSADFEFSSKVIGRVLADYQRRDIDEYFFSGATQLASTVYNSVRDLTRYTVSPELEIIPGPHTSFTATFNYGKYLRDETRIFRVSGLVQPQAPWREWNEEVRLTGRHAWQAFGQDNPLQAGYEFRREQLSRGSLAPANSSNPLGLDEKEHDINIVWLQQEINPTAKLKLTAGFRYDDYSDFGSEWSPKFSAVVTPAGNHRVRASYGHGFRAPYFGELFLNTPPFFVGNPDLKPESSDTFTGGYSYASSRVQGSLDYSWAKVKNGIVFDLTGFPFTYGNLNEYTARALNASFSAALPAGFTPSVSYTYIRRENEDGDNVGGFPENAFFLKLLWSNPRLGLRANFRGQVNGEQPPSLTDSSFVPSYAVCYAQVQKKVFARGAYAFTVFAQVDNIFDKQDIFRRRANGDPIPNDFQIWIAPRTFLAGITIDMDWTR